MPNINLLLLVNTNLFFRLHNGSIPAIFVWHLGFILLISPESQNSQKNNPYKQKQANKIVWAISPVRWLNITDVSGTISVCIDTAESPRIFQFLLLWMLYILQRIVSLKPICVSILLFKYRVNVRLISIQW
jgi:hypothetical protein